jgi:PadR family transcriptional regulator AphA
MEYVVLGLLILSPSSIYQLSKAFEQGISLFYSASLGNIQRALKLLEQKGFVEILTQEKTGRKKTIYGITIQGREAFDHWMVTPPELSNLETIALAKVYFLGIYQDSRIKQQILSGIITQINQMRSQLKDLQQHLSSLPISKSEQEVFLYQVKTLEYGIMAHEAALTWFQTELDSIIPSN